MVAMLANISAHGWAEQCRPRHRYWQASAIRRRRAVDTMAQAILIFRDYAPRDRKVITHGALRSLKKRESVSNLLPIIDEFALVRASESRKTEQALRVRGRSRSERPNRTTAAFRGRPTASSLEQGNWISRFGMIHPLSPHRLINRSNDLGGIQVHNGERSAADCNSQRRCGCIRSRRAR
jgi:hypothetical protein